METEVDKKAEIEWYRENVVPYYKEIVENRRATQILKKIKRKESIDVPKWLR